MQSEKFMSKEGLRQKGVVSLTLFHIILEDVLKEIKKQRNEMVWT